MLLEFSFTPGAMLFGDTMDHESFAALYRRATI